MNKYITYTARAKLRNIIDATEDVKAIRLTAQNGGFEIICMHEQSSENDILICSNPRIFTDHLTLKLLKIASIDFSYALNEFIITKAKNELLAYA
jgi:Fe-S cluster assembly iron-binding protein IscA